MIDSAVRNSLQCRREVIEEVRNRLRWVVIVIKTSAVTDTSESRNKYLQSWQVVGAPSSPDGGRLTR